MSEEMSDEEEISEETVKKLFIRGLERSLEITDRGVRLFERLVIAVERAVEIADRQTSARGSTRSWLEENEEAPPSIEEPAPSRQMWTASEIKEIVPKVRDAGSAHGISNLLFFAVAPKIVRLLLRDDRAIAHGLLASSIDEGVGCRPERRTRVLARLQAELGLISTHALKRGQPATVKITDVELAKMWLAEVEGTA